MFSYLHAIVAPTGVYAATVDFGTQQGTYLSQRITKAANDFARLLQTCGTHRRRDTFTEEVTAMHQVLTSTTDSDTQHGHEPTGTVED